MLIKRAELCTLIPHSGSMCLLDGVISWDSQKICCVSYSHQSISNPLRKNGILSAIHAMEYGAQAMAVHGGILARTANRPPQPGYLAALRDAQLFVTQLQNLDAALEIIATQLVADNGNLMYSFEIKADDTPIAAARATVVSRPHA